MPKSAEELLLESLRALQISASYSDMKIICGDRIFHVHKAIVCTRSKFFKASCNWRESTEAKSEIELPDDDPHLIGLMVDYFYQLEYDDSRKPLAVFGNDTKAVNDLDAPIVVPGFDQSTTAAMSSRKKRKASRAQVQTEKVRAKLKDEGGDLDSSPLVVNVQMYSLADKYDIAGLKELARLKFYNLAGREWQSLTFAHAAELICETTPDKDHALRDIVIETLNSHRELLDYEEIQTLLDSGNGLAWKLLKRNWPPQSTCLECGYCSAERQ